MTRVNDIDWGPATPEAYDDLRREALHVLNVNLVGEQNRKRVVRFAIARVLHFAAHLPMGGTQRIRFDLRGQMIGNKTLNHVRGTIVEELAKRRIQVIVEFLSN